MCRIGTLTNQEAFSFVVLTISTIVLITSLVCLTLNNMGVPYFVKYGAYHSLGLNIVLLSEIAFVGIMSTIAIKAQYCK